MFDRHFFGTQLGKAAIFSVAAMMTFTIFVGIMPAPEAQTMLLGAPTLELA